MALSNTARWALGAVASLAFAGGVTSITIRSVEPASVAFVAERGVSMSVLRFVNSAVNRAFRPNPECYAGGCSGDYEPRLSGNADCKNIAASKVLELYLAGARLDEVSMWVAVQKDFPNVMHIVVVHEPTGAVLDNLDPVVRHRSKRPDLKLLAPCPACAKPAQAAAEALRPGIFAGAAR